MNACSFVLFAMFLASNLAYAEEVKVGDSFLLLECYEIQMKNTFPISNKNRTFQPGDKCFIQKDSRVTALGTIIATEEIFAHYLVTVTTQAKGNLCPNQTNFVVGNICPSQTVFFVSKSKFADMKTKPIESQTHLKVR
ncbi:MAG: hypothetical protein JWN37_735 [Candidatus Nomurabacteria bacterium]|nr:hypothetical protein [Candidatus Nomurabacteria bacterium]